METPRKRGRQTGEEATTSKEDEVPEKKRPRTDEKDDASIDSAFHLFEDLPMEIAVKCLEYLSSEDRKNYRLVSRKSKELIDSHQSLQREYLKELIISDENLLIPIFDRAILTKCLEPSDFIPIRHKLLNCHIDLICKKTSFDTNDTNEKQLKMLQQLVDIFKDGNLSVNEMRWSFKNESDAIINELLECAQPRELCLVVSEFTSIPERRFKIPSKCKLLRGSASPPHETYDLSTAKGIKCVYLNCFRFKFAPHSTGVFSSELVKFFQTFLDPPPTSPLPPPEWEDFVQPETRLYKQLHKIGFKARWNPKDRSVLIVSNREHFTI